LNNPRKDAKNRYFYECALLGGKPPDNIEKFLPWNMTEKQKRLFSEPPKYEDSG